VKWLIKNPAPLDVRLKKWGDFHFGRYLTKWLGRLGHEVDTDYYGQWGSAKTAEVVLVLRGRYPCRRRKGGFGVLWIISHPEEVTLEECASYDLIFTASHQHAAWLGSRLDVPVHPLLQCVDTEDFHPHERPDGHPRTDIIFVGNTREERRDCVVWAVESGLDVKVWGRGWERWIDRRFIKADYIANEDLPRIYSGAKVTFNDHWPDMRRCGFVNNRVFEALACGLPVISDYHPAVRDLFSDAVLCYENRKEFSDCIERVLLEYPRVLARVSESIGLMDEKHSFRNRASELLDKVLQVTGS
jgi:spore maturation protein CgeB